MEDIQHKHFFTEGSPGKWREISTSKDIWYSKGIRNYFLNALHILNIIIFLFFVIASRVHEVGSIHGWGIKKKKKRNFQDFYRVIFFKYYIYEVNLSNCF
jgi:hypothetical protein